MMADPLGARAELRVERDRYTYYRLRRVGSARRRRPGPAAVLAADFAGIATARLCRWRRNAGAGAGTGRLAAAGRAAPEPAVPPGAGDHAGSDRCARGGRSGRHARCHGAARRRPVRGQPAGSDGPGDRPLGAGGPLRLRRRAGAQCENRVQPQPRTVRVPALGTERVRQLPRGAAGDRHRAPGQSGVPRERGDDRPARLREDPPLRWSTPIPWWAPTRTPP